MASKLESAAGAEYIAKAAYDERREIDHVLATACGDIARGTLNFVRQQCPLGETCLLSVRLGCDDSGDMSSATYSCTAEETGCETRTAIAAEQAEARIESLVSVAKKRVDETIATFY